MATVNLPTTVLEGTPEEIATFLRALPPQRYHVEILGLADSDRPRDFLAESLECMANRTPEAIQADRAEILAAAAKPRDLPPGRSLFDVVEGTWPGEETDEEIHDALERLS